MKRQIYKTNQRSILWYHRIAALLVSAMLSACASNSQRFERVVAFGDSLTDQGNYKLVSDSLGVPDAGRFTTNPDAMWVEQVALRFDLRIQARAAAGTNYAEGFARNKLAAPPQPGLSQTPVDQQVTAFLARDRFTNRDLVLINGGGNDVLLAALGGTGTASLEQAAKDFVATLTQVVNAGASNVFVLSTPNLGIAPVGGSGAGGAANPLTQLVSYYNSKVRHEVQSAKLSVSFVDANGFIDSMFYSPAKFGFTDVITPGCSNGDFTAFACGRSAQQPEASTKFLMADKIHLAGRAQRLLGDYVADVIAGAAH
jgi:outer membrane lipase/esterase